MTSLRDSIKTLRKYAPSKALNLSDVYKFMLMELPLTVGELIDRILSLPESVPFHANISTDVAMRGNVSLDLDRGGGYRFRGSMRATGAFSFSFRVGIILRSASGQVSLALQHSGKVFGTDTPGDREVHWNEDQLASPESAKTNLIRDLWSDISGGRMTVRTTAELSGVLATVADVLKDVTEVFLVAETLGASLAICVVISSELGDLGLRMPGLGGVLGIAIIAGSIVIWGPLAIGPAFLVGVAVGEVVDLLIQIRTLNDEEMDFVKQVFGDSLNFDKIRITNMVGLKGLPFTLPTLDDHILLNIGVNDAMFHHPTTTAIKAYPVPGQLLIHEMTHAWQIQHATLAGGYVPGWLCTGIAEQELIGRRSYNYGDPGTPWDSLHNEAQAHIVDEWFAGTGQQAPPDVLPPGFQPRPDNKMNPDGRYFGYIENDIRTASF